MRRSRQGGEGKIGLIIFILVIAAVVFFAVKIVPPKVNVSEMKTFTDELALDWAMSPSYMRHNPEMIKKVIIEKAQELEIPLTEKQITAIKGGSKSTIQVKFELPVDFVVYTYTLKVDHKSKGGL
jgi:hypothetical protein